QLGFGGRTHACMEVSPVARTEHLCRLTNTASPGLVARAERSLAIARGALAYLFDGKSNLNPTRPAIGNPRCSGDNDVAAVDTYSSLNRFSTALNSSTPRPKSRDTIASITKKLPIGSWFLSNCIPTNRPSRVNETSDGFVYRPWNVNSLCGTCCTHIFTSCGCSGALITVASTNCYPPESWNRSVIRASQSISNPGANVFPQFLRTNVFVFAF